MAIFTACWAFLEPPSSLLGDEEVDAFERTLMAKWELTSTHALSHMLLLPCGGGGGGGAGLGLPQRRVGPKHTPAMPCPGLFSEKKSSQRI